MKRTLETSGFFHTLVVVGSSIALSCGGKAEDSSGLVDLGDGDGDTTEGTGGGHYGTGGLANHSGGTGGALASGGSGTGGAFVRDCPPEQWDCGEYQCNWLSTEQIGTGCECDRERPTSAEECPPETRLVCKLGFEEQPGDQYSRQAQPFQCMCLGEQATCANYCDALRSGAWWPPGEACDNEEAILCGCELTLLR